MSCTIHSGFSVHIERDFSRGSSTARFQKWEQSSYTWSWRRNRFREELRIFRKSVLISNYVISVSRFTHDFWRSEQTVNAPWKRSRTSRYQLQLSNPHKTCQFLPTKLMEQNEAERNPISLTAPKALGKVCYAVVDDKEPSWMTLTIHWVTLLIPWMTLTIQSRISVLFALNWNIRDVCVSVFSVSLIDNILTT